MFHQFLSFTKYFLGNHLRVGSSEELQNKYYTQQVLSSQEDYPLLSRSWLMK